MERHRGPPATGRLRQALTDNRAETRPDAEDPRLRGRTYAIPFERVWSAALGLAAELPRWSVLRADDHSGEIVAEASTLVFRFVGDVTIRIFLDPDAQTRVDMESRSRSGRADLGVSARRIARFLLKLDQRLDAGSAKIPAAQR